MLARKPVDRCHAVYLIILLNGFGILMTWNMWITIAPAYYMNYKLIEVDRNGTKNASPYALNFLSYLVVASNLPNFALNLINLFITFNGNLEKRIILSLMIMGLICLITLAFTVIDTSEMITVFFITTIITVVIQNAACGVYQNTLYGLAAIFPPHYTSAILLGSNICGTFVSVINIITLVVTNNIKTAAFLYFFISLLAVLACLGSLFVLVKLDFYKYYMQKESKKMQKRKAKEMIKFKRSDSVREIISKGDKSEVYESTNSSENTHVDLLKMNFQAKLHLYYSIFKQIWPHCFNVWFIFVVTLTLFPTVMAEVKYYSETGKYNFFIPEKLFTPIITYLLFNLFACFGTFLANFVQWPEPKWLVIPVLTQSIFVPLMLFCNFRPAQRSWGVLIYNIWIYIALVVTMATCSGYFSALAMMYAPKQVEASKSTVAGMITAFFLIFGVICGTLFTFVVIWFIDSLGPIEPGKS